MNLALALVALVILGLWMRLGGPLDPDTTDPMIANGQQVLWIFTTTNVALALFNLLPIPPLDGSSILANFHAGYRQWIRAPELQSAMLVVLLIVMVGASRAGWGPFEIAYRICKAGLRLFAP